MRLKRLEIFGFKSFMDRTSFTFEPGVTAVVGPNGCGKSNIVDAIRWVMGEHSAKALRGKYMDDVIFNGSEDHPPLGMTEVVLTLENTNGSAPRHLANCSEIEISRRLFRSGESEYAINRIPCRRRDVWEFFMDTGLGARSYAIVEQERVSKIVHARPQDRRQIIDEVAGIAKYKSRREAAQRKLEATTQNLLRVQDVLQEVGSQMKALEKQAKKAKRYKEIKAMATDTQRRVRLHQWLKLFQEASELRTHMEGLQEQRGRLLDEIHLREARIEARRLEAMELEREASEWNQRCTSWQAKIRTLETDILSARKEIQASEEISKLLMQEIEEIENNLTELRQRRSEEARLLEQTDSQVSQLMGEISSMEENNREKRESFEELSRALEALKNELVDCLSKRAEARNAMEHNGRRRVEIQRSLERHRRQLDELARQIEAKRNEREGLLVRLSERQKRERELVGSHHRISTQLTDAKRELAMLSKRMQEVKVEIAERSARLSSLVEIQNSLEGFPRGVRELKEANAKGNFMPGTDLRVVAEVLDADPEYISALEGALGERWQFIILHRWQELEEAVRFVRERDIGRVGFVVKGDSTRQDGRMRAKDVMGDGLSRFVSLQPGYEWLADRLFGRFRLAGDIGEALNIIKKETEDSAVTMDGIVLEPSLIAQVGSKSGQAAAYMERRRQINELESALEGLYIEEKALEAKLHEWHGRVENLSELLSKTEAERESLSGILAEEKRALRGLEDSISSLTQRAELLGWDIKDAEEELEGLERGLKGCQDELSSLEGKIKTLEEEVTCREQKKRELEKDLAQQMDSMTKMRVRLASLNERLESARKEVHRLDEAQRELMAQHQAKINKVGQMSKRRSELEGQIEQLLEQTKQCMAKHSHAEEMKRHKDIALEEKKAEVQGLEKQINEFRGHLNKLTQELQDHVLRERELTLRMEHLEEELRSRLSVEGDDLQSLARGVEDLDMDHEERRLQRLTESLERFGEVNLVAAEQYDEMRSRYEYLSSQKEDLEMSIHSLNKAIKRIDRASRRKFRQAFSAVDAQFRRVFPVLFNGGEAHLELTDSNDVLEAGLEIIARPPGKLLQNLSLLSGGEKALTAVALIFATLMIRKVPFCLLDEVDAPLDDANIDRFVHMVKELSRESQFILVTHNKKTMEMADVLYGITMESPGISKLISVKFN